MGVSYEEAREAVSPQKIGWENNRYYKHKSQIYVYKYKYGIKSIKVTGFYKVTLSNSDTRR